MSEELVKRLRTRDLREGDFPWRLRHEAADTIERLTAERNQEETRADNLGRAIHYALKADDGLEWLRAWSEGDPEAMADFDAIGALEKTKEG